MLSAKPLMFSKEDWSSKATAAKLFRVKTFLSLKRLHP